MRTPHTPEGHGHGPELSGNPSIRKERLLSLGAESTWAAGGTDGGPVPARLPPRWDAGGGRGGNTEQRRGPRGPCRGTISPHSPAASDAPGQPGGARSRLHSLTFPVPGLGREGHRGSVVGFAPEGWCRCLRAEVWPGARTRCVTQERRGAGWVGGRQSAQGFHLAFAQWSEVHSGELTI